MPRYDSSQEEILKTHTPSQHGYTLVELAISVAILSVLIVAGLKGVQSILLSNQVNEQVRKIAKAKAKLAAYFYIQPSTVGWAIGPLGKFGKNSAFGTFEEAVYNGVAIGDNAIGTSFVYKIASVPQAACADLANSVAGLVYAMHIKPVGSVYPVNWTTETSVVKAPGTASVNIAALGRLCDANAESFDFYMALDR